MSVPSSLSKQFFSPPEMMGEAEKFALSKTSKSTTVSICLAIMAGLFIGLAFLFYITVTTGSTEQVGWGLSRLAGGFAFSLGLILIVICGGELFTSTVLSSIALANKQITFKKMFSIWSKVYLGNFIGASILLILVTAAGLYQMDHGQWGVNALMIAQHKLHHTPIQAFALGVLCNLLVCLAIWMSFSAANALTKAFMVILPVAMFVSSGFEHCVANMFMVPLGISIQSMAPPEFWTQVGLSPDQFTDLNWLQFISANLIPVTLGNIIGGAVLVGLANWFIYRQVQCKAVITQSNVSIIKTQPTQNLPKKESTIMSAKQTVKSILQHQAFSLNTDMLTATALDKLLKNNLEGAPVIDKNGQLVGFMSLHDVLVDLWCQGYIPVEGQKVVDLMSREIVAINANDSLIDLVEFMCIDKEKLFPVTDSGIATHLTTLSLEERAKQMHVSRPHILPVVEEGKLIGVVTRSDVVRALRSVYGENLKDVSKNASLEIA
ncbi:formate transporter FocA [Zooshikella ganghwensis]|uniref:Formate transporter FocA n=1 Tax=Zooshikella ganghwensis TaxID=202772 RepID=A0A4P9VKD4_9GAMM|nr:formate transporter FocA [Zooshikella ganghwensis]RDH42610.1 formate transporter FocA [Zooshikella ganghwensis]